MNTLLSPRPGLVNEPSLAHCARMVARIVFACCVLLTSHALAQNADPVTSASPAALEPAAPVPAEATTEPGTAPVVESTAPSSPPIVAAQLSKPPAPLAESATKPPKHNGPGPRIELSLLSAPLGAGLGLSLCFIGECADGRRLAGSMLLGAGAGVALSALVTRYTGLEYATAQAIEGGAIWGATTPLYLWLLTSSARDGHGLAGGMAAGELLGAGLGGLLERALRPSSGAVALANSGSLWLSAMGTLIAFSTHPDIDNDSAIRALGGGLLAAQAIGLGLGGMLGQRFQSRRSQVWLSDVGAVLLGGTAPLLAWLFAGEDVASEALLGATAAGMGIGFVSAYLLTEFLPSRGKVAAAERAASTLGGMRLAMMPVRNGGGVSLSARLR